MFRLFRWLVRGLAAAFVLALAGIGIVYYLASHSLPVYNATHTLARLDRPVEIVRDNHAVPHIFAQTDADALFGLGFVHAQDRLWQMMLLRRTAQGRLSELFGPETVSIDILMRALDLYGVSVAAAQTQTPAVTAELEAYSAGVNAYLDLIQKESLGRGAPEFFVFSPAISPWTPADSIAVQKLMAFQLSGMADREVLRAELTLRLPPERVADILPLPDGRVIDLPDFAQLFDDPRFAQLPDTPRHPLDPSAPFGLAGASNAFAADPSRTASKGSLLATDPHLSLQAPGHWMLARLEFSGGGVIGGTIPGIPAVLVGRNADLAWGLTTSYLDDQDIYIERLDPANPDAYETPGGMQPFETRDTIISVLNAPPQTHRLRWTRHGPVIPAPHFRAAAVTPAGHVAALSWTALTPNDRSLEAAMALMRARDVDSALRTGRLVVAPSQNLIVADRTRVAQKAVGLAPRRDAASASQGRIPSAGWRAENDWQGYFDYDDNPGVTDPTGGIVVNTNNRLTDQSFPRHWSFDWGDSFRIRRAERLLNEREFHTLDSFVQAQTDTVSPAARALLPLVARNLWYQGEPAAVDTIERQRQIALEALAAWTGEMSEHGYEPLIHAAWMAELQRRLTLDELGPLAGRLSRPEPQFLERVFRDTDGASAWCDIRQSDAVETCETIARQSLDAALLSLAESHGTRIDGWRWGAAHQALHRHQALGRVPGLSWLVNIRHETPGGDFTLLRGQTRAAGDEPFLNVHASGFRAVVDLADPDSSIFVVSTGQSGHFLSRHYDDLSLLWRRSEYIPMSLDPVLARGGAVGVTRLLPGA